jgi:hypothetical protein
VLIAKNGEKRGKTDYTVEPHAVLEVSGYLWFKNPDYNLYTHVGAR